MRPRLILGTALLMLAGCAADHAGPALMGFGGPPALPTTFSVADQSTPSLPAKGPVGRGALLYRSPQSPLVIVLVLENGRQFRLAAPPRGEGRQGSLYASLSPDGRWLGHRVAAYTGDRRYVVQELTGARLVLTDGLPVLWSADSRLLVTARDESATGELTLVEPATGRISSMGTGRYRDGLWLAGVLPDGQPLFSNAPSRSLRLRTGDRDTTVVFAAGADDECWCPHSTIHLSPDGRSVSVQLAYDGGLVPGTGLKSSPMPANSAVVAVIDPSSGTVAHRVTLTAAGPTDSWQLLSDTGSGLVAMRRGAGAASLFLLDPATGNPRLATELPDGISILVPGQVDGPSDG